MDVRSRSLHIQLYARWMNASDYSQDRIWTSLMFVINVLFSCCLVHPDTRLDMGFEFRRASDVEIHVSNQRSMGTDYGRGIGVVPWESQVFSIDWEKRRSHRRSQESLFHQHWTSTKRISGVVHWLIVVSVTYQGSLSLSTTAPDAGSRDKKDVGGYQNRSNRRDQDIFSADNSQRHERSADTDFRTKTPARFNLGLSSSLLCLFDVRITSKTLNEIFAITFIFPNIFPFADRMASFSGYRTFWTGCSSQLQTLLIRRSAMSSISSQKSLPRVSPGSITWSTSGPWY